MKLFEKIRRKQAGCLLRGCDAEIRACGTCGWNKQEAVRRRNLPLTRGADGLRRMLVGGERV
ncbi:MAG: hypothetical protein IKC04_02865 [Oscillospiraceae bacterium]|nr:hypothetical protein [Oscillospiraceae bacterium]